MAAPTISPSVLDPNDKNSIINIIKSGNLTTGNFVSEFENKFTTYLGTVKHESVAVSNGTAALHLVLECIKHNLKISPFDKHDRYVIVPAFSFNSTANVVLLAGFKADQGCVLILSDKLLINLP